MQKHSDPSSFLVNNTGAPHGDEDGCTAMASNSSFNYFLISSYSYGLCRYMDFHTGSVLSSRGISCMSPSFQLGSACVGNVPGNTSRYLHSIECNEALFFSSTFGKYGIAPSRRFFSLYNTY